jgi:phage terminase Nu1 subunit (DNA packaging protein)
MANTRVWFTVTEYALHRKLRGLPGATRQSVYSALKTGRIVRGENGKIHATEADAAWAASTGAQNGSLAKSQAAGVVVPIRPGATGTGTTGHPHTDAEEEESYAEARTRKEVATANLKELEAAEKRGDLVDAHAAARQFRSMTSAARDRIMSIPQRIAGRLAGITDENEVLVLLDDELRDALDAVADEALSKARAASVVEGEDATQ